MKKIKQVLNLWIVLSLFFTSLSYAVKFDGGKGTMLDPYLISNAEQLKSIGSDKLLLDKHFKLTADIDLESENFTTAIIAPDFDNSNTGFDGLAFTGTLNGNGCKILSLVINTRDDSNAGNDNNDYLGLFGQIGIGGGVKDLGIIKSSINAGADSINLGMLAGHNLGVIMDCYSINGSVGEQYYPFNVGGLIGKNEENLTGCYSTCNVNGTDSIGGLIGSNSDCTLTDCYSIGDILGRNQTGGLIGFCSSSSVTSCYAAGSVSGRDRTGGLIGFDDQNSLRSCSATGSVEGDTYVGGLTGYSHYGDIAESCSTGSVNSSDRYVGGLVGMGDYIWVLRSYAVSDVSGNSYTGGLIGMTEGCRLFDCYSRGSVSGDNQVGGLVGLNSIGSMPIHCYSASVITCTGETFGGLVGRNGFLAGVSSSFWDVEVTGTSISDGGIGLTTEQMMLTYHYRMNGWSGDTWTLDIGNDYPHLAWENAPGDLIADPTVTMAGSGSPEDPWIIETKNDLEYISMGSYFWDDKHYILNADIDLSGETYEKSLIGINPFDPFTGSFNGNGHIVNYLNINGQRYLGLFGYISEGTIKNLGLLNVNINGSESYVGALAGCIRASSVINCYSTGTVTGNRIAGGLLGHSTVYHETRSNIEDCYSTCDVNGEAYRIGCLSGSADYTDIANCYSTGTSTGNERIGGLTGQVYESSVSCCYSTGTVTGNEETGGLAGLQEESIFSNCFWNYETSGVITSAGGDPKTTTEMQTLSTFTDAGWDFDNDWWINDQRDYPRLSWQPFGDINNDSRVNLDDFIILLAAWLTDNTHPDYNSIYELSGDNIINLPDLSAFSMMWLAGPEYCYD